MANELSLSTMLNDKLLSVESALPKNFNRERFVQNCLTVVNEKPELAKVNKAQLQLGLLKAAYLGLDFMNKECYLIPYGSTVQFQTDYKGECKFAKRYSVRPIKDIMSQVVREGDVFQTKIVDNVPIINFEPLPFNTGAMVGVFAVVYFEDGGILFETMSKADVEVVRTKFSKQGNGKAWKDSYDEMARKTVIRRLMKHIDCDFESSEARKVWEETSPASFENKNDTKVDNPFDDEVIQSDAIEVEVIDNAVE